MAMSLLERIRRLGSPEASERGAEGDVIERSPESVRSRLRAVVQRRRQAAEDEGGSIMAGRRRAWREAEEGR